MNEQQKYKEHIFKYFSDHDISIPENMNVCYTEPDPKSDKYLAEYDCKDDQGIWYESGYRAGGQIYFMGDYKIGFVINSDLLKIQLISTLHGKIETDGKRYNLIPRLYMIQNAVLITYFRRLKWPASHEYQDLKNE